MEEIIKVKKSFSKNDNVHDGIFIVSSNEIIKKRYEVEMESHHFFLSNKIY